jgi:ribonuclease BN (tRNA processing enzyme)
MRLTVLGKYGLWPKAGCACSGYLLEAGGRLLLLDCGPGILSRLQERCPIERLDALLLSHLHGDHAGDVSALRYALPYFMGKGLMKEPFPVFLPATPEDVAAAVFNDENVGARVTRGGDSFDFLGLRLSFFRVRHPVECNAVRVEHEGKTFVFSGDMNTTGGFEEFAQGADMLLIDGCFLEADWNEGLPHLSAALAAGVGKRAGAKRVLLTHFRPVDDEAALLAEARRADPSVEAAAEGAAYVF